MRPSRDRQCSLGRQNTLTLSQTPAVANPAEQIDRLDKTLTAAGVRHRGEVYAGAHHGFTQADTAMHSPEATERHWTALLDLLARNL